MDLELTKNKGLIGKGMGVDLTDNTATDVMTIPYNSVMEVKRIEIANNHTTDGIFTIINSFTDTNSVARTEIIGTYKVVAGLTVGIDVEGSKKAFGTVQAQCDIAAPSPSPTVYVGGVLL